LKEGTVVGCDGFMILYGSQQRCWCRIDFDPDRKSRHKGRGKRKLEQNLDANIMEYKGEEEKPLMNKSQS
jgi:hypothetical protein